MEFNIENLKRRSQIVRDEKGKGKNTSERIGGLFYDIVLELNNVVKKLNRKIFIWNFIAIVISIFSLVFSICKSDDINVDGANLLGVMVGVLSFLVTVMLGYQIYKTIEIEDVIERKINSVERRMYDAIKDYVDIKIDAKKDEID